MAAPGPPILVAVTVRGGDLRDPEGRWPCEMRRMALEPLSFAEARSLAETMLGGDAQGHLLARAADQYRDRPVDRLRLVPRPARLDGLDLRLARIEEQLRHVSRRPSGRPGRFPERV